MGIAESLLSHPLVGKMGWTLVHFVWQAVVVSLLLAFALRLLRESGPNIRYVTACLALGAMATMPVITLQWVDIAPRAMLAKPQTPTSPLAGASAVQQRVATQTGGSLETAAWRAWIGLKKALVARLDPGLPYLVVCWLAGVCGLSAWHMGGWAQLQRLKWKTVRKANASLQRRLEDLAEGLGVHRAVRLLESVSVDVPTAMGWLRPVILLPASALVGLSPDQLQAILAHELAHVRRNDYLVNVLQTAVEILGFYHPAVWWVSRRIRVERENCCDDLAVQACGDRVCYAKALACMEAIRHKEVGVALAASGGSLVHRISRLAGSTSSDRGWQGWMPALVVLLLMFGLVVPAGVALAVRGDGPPRILEAASAPAATEELMIPVDTNQAAAGAAIEIETQVLTVSEALLKRIGLGRDASPSARPAPAGGTVATAMPPAAQSDAVVMTDADLSLLLEATQANRGARVLAAPQVSVCAGKEATVFLGSKMPYIRGYAEPNKPGGKPEPQGDTIEEGIRLRLRPELPTADTIRLDVELTITDVLGFKRHRFHGRYPYQIPEIDMTSLTSRLLVPDGATVLLCSPKARTSAQTTRQGGKKQAEPRVLLIKARRVNGGEPPKPVLPQPRPPVSTHAMRSHQTEACYATSPSFTAA